jgi:hypothetical protein
MTVVPELEYELESAGWFNGSSNTDGSGAQQLAFLTSSW